MCRCGGWIHRMCPGSPRSHRPWANLTLPAGRPRCCRAGLVVWYRAGRVVRDGVRSHTGPITFLTGLHDLRHATPSLAIAERSEQQALAGSEQKPARERSHDESGDPFRSWCYRMPWHRTAVKTVGQVLHHCCCVGRAGCRRELAGRRDGVGSDHGPVEDPAWGDSGGESGDVVFRGDRHPLIVALYSG